MSLTSSPRPISFGFLLIPLQALDLVGPMDILSNISHDMLERYAPEPQRHIIPYSPQITFHYISHIPDSLEPVRTTGNCHIAPTTTMADCPPLDYLLVGGPMPEYALNLSEPVKGFIREQAKVCKTVFTTCTGSLVVAAAGVLDGREATVNHLLVGLAREAFGKVEWDGKRHWVVSEGMDGGCTFWTSAGAGAGMDMLAEWVRVEFEKGQELVDISTSVLEWRPSDVSGKPMSYVNGNGVRVDMQGARL